MMSMGTGICLPGQKRYVYTFMTGPIVRVRAGMLSAPSRRTWVSPAPQSNALLTTWSGWAKWRSSPATGRTVARLPTCTDCENESKRKKQPPHQGEAAPFDWTWGRVIEAHPEDPRRRMVIFREEKHIIRRKIAKYGRIKRDTCVI